MVFLKTLFKIYSKIINGIYSCRRELFVFAIFPLILNFQACSKDSNDATAADTTDTTTIDLATILPGTTWTFVNKTSESNLKNNTGTIVFASNGSTFTVTVNDDSDNLDSSETLLGMGYTITSIGPVTYEILNNEIMIMNSSDASGNSQEFASLVLPKSTSELSMVRFGQLNGLNGSQVSVLTKVE